MKKSIAIISILACTTSSVCIPVVTAGIMTKKSETPAGQRITLQSVFGGGTCSLTQQFYKTPTKDELLKAITVKINSANFFINQVELSTPTTTSATLSVKSNSPDYNLTSGNSVSITYAITLKSISTDLNSQTSLSDQLLYKGAEKSVLVGILKKKYPNLNLNQVTFENVNRDAATYVSLDIKPIANSTVYTNVTVTGFKMYYTTVTFALSTTEVAQASSSATSFSITIKPNAKMTSGSPEELPWAFNYADSAESTIYSNTCTWSTATSWDSTNATYNTVVSFSLKAFSTGGTARLANFLSLSITSVETTSNTIAITPYNVIPRKYFTFGSNVNLNDGGSVKGGYGISSIQASSVPNSYTTLMVPKEANALGYGCFWTNVTGAVLGSNIVNAVFEPPLPGKTALNMSVGDNVFRWNSFHTLVYPATLVKMGAAGTKAGITSLYFQGTSYPSPVAGESQQYANMDGNINTALRNSNGFYVKNETAKTTFSQGIYTNSQSRWYIWASTTGPGTMALNMQVYSTSGLSYCWWGW